MGLLSNVKGKITNLFTEEVEEEMPIKKEVKHVEIQSPRREIIKEEPAPILPEEEKREPISESVALREEKFKFPVYFDDQDFADLPKAEPVKKKEEKKEEPKVEPYKAAKMVEEKRNFRPSPIISPVYGVLDKNYKKDEIHTKREHVVRPYREDKPMTVDDIRKKAYGTLEDELENTLFSGSPIVTEEPAETEIDIFKELEETEKMKHAESTEMTGEITLNDTVDLTRELERQKQKIDELNTFIKNNTISKEEEEEVQEPVIDYTSEEPISSFETPAEVVEPIQEEGQAPEEIETVSEPEEEVKEEPLKNGDLFNLIDSMYEKRED